MHQQGIQEARKYAIASLVVALLLCGGAGYFVFLCCQASGIKQSFELFIAFYVLATLSTVLTPVSWMWALKSITLARKSTGEKDSPVENLAWLSVLLTILEASLIVLVIIIGSKVR